MSDEMTLLPCPFCGGEAQIVEGMYSSFQEGYAVRCRHCALTLGASGRLGECYEWSCSFATEAEAITAWNTRTDYHGYEQAAIEAWKSIKAWNTRATHGTLTAEQVKRIHEIIEKHWHDLPDEYDMPEATALPEYSYNWQAIADELNAKLGSECDKWKAKAEEAGRAMNAAAGLWAKADAENRELRKMLLLDDGTVEEYTERANPLTALAYQKQLAEEWRDRCHNAEALCDKLEAERDELSAKLGSGTCELLYGEDDDGYDGWYCDECGGWFQAVRRDGHLVEPKHCQECGKAVKR